MKRTGSHLNTQCSWNESEIKASQVRLLIPWCCVLRQQTTDYRCLGDDMSVDISLGSAFGHFDRVTALTPVQIVY